jgi:carboxymethylenebutenolidase
MCDEQTRMDSEELLSRNMSRRDVGKVAGVAAVAVLLPAAANAMDVTEREVAISTPDGVADCYFVYPSAGKYAAVLIWSDAFGLRPAFRQMGKRLAQSGYSVLVVNPFYREGRAPILPRDMAIMTPESLQFVRGLMGKLSPDMNVTDARAFFAFLDKQPSVDTKRGAGATGYCMGGAMVLRTAAALPGRIGAGASFHARGLVTDKPDSPHLLISQMKASCLIAIAANDDERNPQGKVQLREAFDAAGLPAEIEVYEGAMHGWCPSDMPVYHPQQAERAWSRMLALFGMALAPRSGS